MAAASERHFKLNGNFSLLAVVPSKDDPANLLRMRASQNGLYDYANIALTPNRDRKVQAYLSFDIDGVRLCLSPMEHGRVAPQTAALKPKTNRQVVIAQWLAGLC